MAAIAKLHVLLTEKMGKETTHILADYMDEKIQQEMKLLATKEDITYLKEDITDLKEKIAGVHERIAGVHEKLTDMNADMNIKITNVYVKIADVKDDMLKWTFGLFFAMMLAIIGLYFKQ